DPYAHGARAVDRAMVGDPRCRGGVRLAAPAPAAVVRPDADRGHRDRMVDRARRALPAPGERGAPTADDPQPARMGARTIPVRTAQRQLPPGPPPAHGHTVLEHETCTPRAARRSGVPEMGRPLVGDPVPAPGRART